MKMFDSYEQLRKDDYELYKLLGKLGNCAKYKCQISGKASNWDMVAGGWFVENNPVFVTDAQWAYIAMRMLNYESLHDVSLKEFIKSFYYQQDQVRVGQDRYFVPNGSICGHMQGMFVCIYPNGEACT